MSLANYAKRLASAASSAAISSRPIQQAK